MSEINTIYNAYNLKFIFTIDTRNIQNGSTNSDQYKLPLISTGTYDFVVDWGDGTTDTITQYDQAEATHTYETEGIYEIQIDGKCERVKFGTIPNNTGETLKVLDVKQWGCAKLWLNDYGTPFSNCKNVIMSATDTPQFQETSNYSKIFKQQAFQFCENLTGDFSGWGTEESPLGGSWYVLFQYSYNADVNVSWVGSTSSVQGTFNSNYNFNGDLSRWNVQSVPDLLQTFGRTSFNNDSIKDWNISNVTSMRGTFANTPFNQDIASWENWDVSNVNSMWGTFYQSQFNRDIGSWNVSNVTDFRSMFQNSRVLLRPHFNNGGSPSISGWTLTTDPTKSINMSGMFYENLDFNQPIGSWDTSRVTDMSQMFFNRYSTASFDQDISTWDVSNVTTFQSMFIGHTGMSDENYNKLDSWQVTSACTDLSGMFRSIGTNKLTDVNFSHWDVSNVGNFYGIFAGTGVGKETGGEIGLSSWNVTSACTDIGYMFVSAIYFNEDVSGWDVSNVTQMKETFYNANSFNQNLSSWNISNVINMSSLFNNSGMSTENYSNTLIGWASQAPNIQTGVTLGAGTIQYGSFAEEARDLLTGTYGWTITDGGLYTIPAPTTDLSNYFDDGTDPNGDPIPEDIIYWETSGVTRMNSTFRDATNFNLNITGWDVSNVTDMGLLFFGTPFNQDIGNWNTSLVTRMDYLFYYNSSFNQDIGGWDTSSVTDMRFIFLNASSYNNGSIGGVGIGIDQWDTSSVTRMSLMFNNATSFNQYIGSWDVSSVNEIGGMFLNAQLFNQPLSGWTLGVANVGSMFKNASKFNQDIGNLLLNGVKSNSRLLDMFYGATDFNNGGVGGVNEGLDKWDISNTWDLQSCFRASSFNQYIGSWDTSNVTSMSYTFDSSPFNQDISGWDTSSVTNMLRTFYGSSFNQNLSGWTISNVTNMGGMFDNSGMSTENYSDTLIGWARQAPNIQTGVTLSAIGIKHNAYATEAINILTGTYDWTITDAGLDEDIVMDGLVFSVDAGNTTSYVSGSTTWNDLVGDNDGTLTNGPTFDSGNRGSIVFDGSNDYVLISPSFPEADNAPYTYCVMVFIDQSTGTNQYIVGNGAHSRSEGGSILLYDPSGQQLMRFTSQYDNYNGEVDFQINYGEWLYVVGTNDGLNSINSVKLYINSELKGQTTPTSFTNDPQIPNLTIGTADNVNGGLGLNGKISFVQIYNRALSEAEITQNYNAQKGRFGL